MSDKNNYDYNGVELDFEKDQQKVGKYVRNRLRKRSTKSS